MVNRLFAAGSAAERTFRARCWFAVLLPDLKSGSTSLLVCKADIGSLDCSVVRLLGQLISVVFGFIFIGIFNMCARVCIATRSSLVVKLITRIRSSGELRKHC